MYYICGRRKGFKDVEEEKGSLWVYGYPPSPNIGSYEEGCLYIYCTTKQRIVKIKKL